MPHRPTIPLPAARAAAAAALLALAGPALAAAAPPLGADSPECSCRRGDALMVPSATATAEDSSPVTTRTVGPSLVVLTLLALAAPPAASAPPADDAGDDPSSATLLAGPGAVEGDLRPHDADWYRLASGDEPACATLAATGTNAFDVTIRTQREGNDLASVFTVEPRAGGEAILLVPAGADLLVGVEPAANPAGKTPARPGSYHLDLALAPLSSLAAAGDAGTGLDAGDALESALAAPGPCFGGTLDADGDALDVYAFEAAAGDAALLALDGLHGLIAVDLVDPAGNVLATLGAGDVAEIALPSDGTYALRVGLAEAPTLSTSAAATSFYLLGLEIRPPGSDPCRPNCMSS